MPKVRVVLSCVAILMLVMSSPASSHSSVVNDPVGDLATQTPAVPAFYDILKAKVHATGDERDIHDWIVFSMTVAEPIPQLSSTTFLALNWLLDTNEDGVLDYNVLVRWCTRTPALTTHPRCQIGPAHWEATVNDFSTRPLPFFTTFTVDGDTITLRLRPDALAGTRGFAWFAASRNIAAQSGPAVDVGPDIGFMFFRR